MQPLSKLKSHPLITDAHPLGRPDDLAHFLFPRTPAQPIYAPQRSGGLRYLAFLINLNRKLSSSFASLFQEYSQKFSNLPEIISRINSRIDSP